MTYVDQTKPAQPSDLLDVMRSENPRQTIQVKLSDLANLRRFVEAEHAKWDGLLRTLELFGISDEQPKSEPEAHHAHAGDSTPPPARFTIPRQRRGVLIGILRGEPGRLWRTAELAAEVRKFEPDGAGDMGNLVSRAISVLEQEGLVKRVKKGTVRWVGDSDEPSGGIPGM
jgi:hypothetical protein